MSYLPRSTPSVRSTVLPGAPAQEHIPRRKINRDIVQLCFYPGGRYIIFTKFAINFLLNCMATHPPQRIIEVGVIESHCNG